MMLAFRCNFQCVIFLCYLESPKDIVDVQCTCIVVCLSKVSSKVIGGLLSCRHVKSVGQGFCTKDLLRVPLQSSACSFDCNWNLLIILILFIYLSIILVRIEIGLEIDWVDIEIDEVEVEGVPWKGAF